MIPAVKLQLPQMGGLGCSENGNSKPQKFYRNSEVRR